MTLGQMLREARQKKGWSLSEAAAHLGCRKTHVWELEHGVTRNPTLRLIQSIVREYGITPAKIVSTSVG